MGIVGVDNKKLSKKDPRFKLVKREAMWFDLKIESISILKRIDTSNKTLIN
jgi:hypothetical protein